MPVTLPPDLHSLIIDGFGDHDTDVGAAFDNSSEDQQQKIHEQVVAAAVGAEIIEEQGKFCAVTIIAHSDRVDNAASADEARADELDISVQRGDNAVTWLFEKIQGLLEQAGAPVPQTQDDLQSVAIFRVAAGAAHLVVTNPVSDDDRRQNRRVEFAVASFAPVPAPVL